MSVVQAVRTFLRGAPKEPHGSPAPALTEEERAERDRWEAPFRGITQRLLPRPPRIDVPFKNGDFGDVEYVTISPDPPEIKDVLYRREATCPVCGIATEVDGRLPASLDITFRKGFSYLLGVWVHEACLARCAQTDQQRAIPW